MTLKIVATLKSGGDFEPYDAITLAYQFREHMKVPHYFICLTDMDFGDPMIVRMELKHNWPGWWSMVEMFRIEGPVLAIGLDMIVVNEVSRLAEIALTCPDNTFYMARPQPKAYKRGERWCSGLQLWKGDWRWIYDEFDPDRHIPFFVKEQRYTAHKLHCRGVEIRAIQDYFDGYYSWKNQLQGKPKPEDGRTILFHGEPRPKNCKAKWVKKIYYNQYKYIHPFERIAINHGVQSGN